MKRKACFLFMVILSLQAEILVAQLSAEKIIELMEKNQLHATARFSGSLIIKNRFGTKTKTFIAVSEGNDKLLLEFTSKEERGQKILRLKDEVYIYYPKAEGVVKLQGGALKDSIFGSDFTYEDLTGERGLLSLYKAELVSPEPVLLAGVRCYHLRLTGLVAIAYPYQEVWIDASRFYLRKAVYYSLTNVALKELLVTQTKEVSGKIFPTYFIMTDLQKKNSTTAFNIEKIEIDIILDPKQFTLERLKF